MNHILVVEDDREICQLYSRVLVKNGYQVTCVSNGQEALNAIEQNYFDLIISDIMIPGLLSMVLMILTVGMMVLSMALYVQRHWKSIQQKR